MNITDISIRKEGVGPGSTLVCKIAFEDGDWHEGAILWRNTIGLWASDSDARDPAEIAAYLRNFAKAIEETSARSAA